MKTGVYDAAGMSVDPEARRIRVMIVEDHADFRELMEVLLGRQPDIDLLAQAGSIAEAPSRQRG
jgi:hypothetical protein